MSKKILAVFLSVAIAVMSFTGCDASDTSVQTFESSAEQLQGESVQESSEESQKESVPESSEEPQEESAPESSEEPQKESAPESSEEPQKESAPESSEEPQEESAPESSEKSQEESVTESNNESSKKPGKKFSLSDDVPLYAGKAYAIVNNNIPYFNEKDLTEESFEKYSNLDNLGRCGTAYANIGKDIMPTEERGEIGQVKPSGWHTVKYDCVDGKYLYNRCHLIGYQLSGENANDKNLITGTRYLNIQGMLPFENMTADYVKETNNHVLYRVTPVFEGNDLISKGVLMEGYSVEDNGEGICFCIFAYNVQPGVSIDYGTGNSKLSGEQVVKPDVKKNNSVPNTDVSSSKETTESKPESKPEPQGQTYILNVNSKKIHRPDCPSVKRMKEENKQEFTGSIDELIKMGYSPCKNCKP